MLQFATGTVAWVFQVHTIATTTFPGVDPRVAVSRILHLLTPILCSPDILKVGAGLREDKNELESIMHCQLQGFRDYVSLAQFLGFRRPGLAGMGACVLGLRVVKKPWCYSNWEKARLTPEQITYAATDAWLSREVYLQVQQMI